jgi:uncharacterized membrane protein YfcA
MDITIQALLASNVRASHGWHVLGLFRWSVHRRFRVRLAGFAMGFVVSGIWLHIITPVQTTALIVGYGLWTQGYGVWKLRRSLSFRNVAPFIIGGTIGVPIGTMLLTNIDPAYLRGGVGLLLILYGIYGLTQPAFKPVQAGVGADSGIGFLNGLLSGLTGFPGSSSPSGANFAAGRKTCNARSFSPSCSRPSS